MTSPIDFLRAFIAYVENTGIHNQYDPIKDAMVMSPGVKGLVNMAYRAMPTKLTPLAAAKEMSELTPEHRSKLIAQSEEGKVLDMRQEFQNKMSRNGGAQGLILSLLRAVDDGDEEAVKAVFDDMNKLEKELKDV